jgi:flavin-dependent dehydrogenase
MLSADHVNADVCIIGGGPAGAATAARLAALGHDIVVVEGEPFPRRHIGASLPPGILPLFDVLGVRDRIETAGFPRFNDLLVLWAGDRPEIRHRPGPAGLHVDRARLDCLLLEFAKSSGARVIQPARAGYPRMDGSGRWVTLARGPKTQHAIRSDIVVDASGGRRIAHGTRKRLSAPTVALYATWRLREPPGMEGCVEAGVEEWMWCAPVGDQSIVAALFIDPVRIKGFGRETVERLYAGLILRSRLLGPRLSAATHGPIDVCDASSWASVPAAGPGFLRVGDASVTLDPLSSQGVQAAIASSLQAAVVINTMLRRPASADIAAEFYNARQAERASAHHAIAYSSYRDMLGRFDSVFWTKRAEASVPLHRPAVTTALGAEQRIRLAAGAAIRPAPVALGDFIEQRPALHHHAMERPVAFVAGIELAPLLQKLDDGQTATALLQDWARTYPPGRCQEIANWLWQNEVIVPSP